MAKRYTGMSDPAVGQGIGNLLGGLIVSIAKERSDRGLQRDMQGFEQEYAAGLAAKPKMNPLEHQLLQESLSRKWNVGKELAAQLTARQTQFNDVWKTEATLEEKRLKEERERLEKEAKAAQGQDFSKNLATQAFNEMAPNVAPISNTETGAELAGPPLFSPAQAQQQLGAGDIFKSISSAEPVQALQTYKEMGVKERAQETNVQRAARLGISERAVALKERQQAREIEGNEALATAIESLSDPQDSRTQREKINDIAAIARKYGIKQDMATLFPRQMLINAGSKIYVRDPLTNEIIDEVESDRQQIMADALGRRENMAFQRDIRKDLNDYVTANKATLQVTANALPEMQKAKSMLSATGPGTTTEYKIRGFLDFLGVRTDPAKLNDIATLQSLAMRISGPEYRKILGAAFTKEEGERLSAALLTADQPAEVFLARLTDILENAEMSIAEYNERVMLDGTDAGYSTEQIKNRQVKIKQSAESAIEKSTPAPAAKPLNQLPAGGSFE